METQTRNLIFLSVAALLGILLVVGGVWYLVYASGFAAIANDKYEIAMKYPKTWTAIKDPQVNVPFAFSSPKESEMDTVLENLNIAIQDLNPEMPLQEFVNVATNQMTVVFKNMTIVQSRPDKVAGLPAHRLVFETKEPDEAMILVVCFYRDTKAYTITYLAQTRNYKKYLGLVNTMIRSVAFPRF